MGEALGASSLVLALLIVLSALITLGVLLANLVQRPTTDLSVALAVALAVTLTLVVATSSLALMGPTPALVVFAGALLGLLAHRTLRATSSPAVDQPPIRRSQLQSLCAQTWADELRAWPDEALFRAWTRTDVRMAQSLGQASTALALERRAYLDEMERRNPTGFEAWMTSGSRTPTDPTRYLVLPPDSDEVR